MTDTDWEVKKIDILIAYRDSLNNYYRSTHPPVNGWKDKKQKIWEEWDKVDSYITFLKNLTQNG